MEPAGPSSDTAGAALYTLIAELDSGAGGDRKTVSLSTAWKVESGPEKSPSIHLAAGSRHGASRLFMILMSVLQESGDQIWIIKIFRSESAHVRTHSCRPLECSVQSGCGPDMWVLWGGQVRASFGDGDWRASRLGRKAACFSLYLWKP